MPVVLAALPDIVVALVITILLFAAWTLFRPLLLGLARRVPLIGGVLSKAIDAIISDSMTAGTVLAESGLSDLEGLILGPVFWFEHLIADLLDIGDTLRQMIAYIIKTYIPEILLVAEAEATVLVAKAVAAIDAAISADVAMIRGEILQVYATINAVEKALAAYTVALVEQAETYTEALITAETRYVGQVEAALQNEIKATVAAETAYIDAEIKSAVAYTTAVEASLISDINAADSAITAWVMGQLGSLVSAIDAVQAVTVSVALEAAAVVEADLNNLKEECTDNLCSGLSDAASLANGLMSQTWVAALLAYAAWGAADPKGCGNATASVLEPVAAGAKDAVDAGMSVL